MRVEVVTQQMIAKEEKGAEGSPALLLTRSRQIGASG